MIASGTFRIAVLATLLWLLVPPEAHAQCALSYSDWSSDGVNLEGWNEIVDYYNYDPWMGNSCAQPIPFYHQYTVATVITSPSNRTSTSTIEGGAIEGGGFYVASYASLEVLDEGGDYTIQTEERIDCSVAGYGFYTRTSNFLLGVTFHRTYWYPGVNLNYPDGPCLYTLHNCTSGTPVCGVGTISFTFYPGTNDECGYARGDYIRISQGPCFGKLSRDVNVPAGGLCY